MNIYRQTRKINDDEVSWVKSFKYFGYSLNKIDGIDKDIIQSIKYGWIKCWEKLDLSFDKRNEAKRWIWWDFGGTGNDVWFIVLADRYKNRAENVMCYRDENVMSGERID